MNKHFKDTRYYLKRAAEHAKAGLEEELEPVRERVQEFVGEEPEPEPSRVERLQQDLKELEAKAEGGARERLAEAREKVRVYRGSEPEQSA